MRFAPGCFWSMYSRPTFLSIFPWSPLGKISENGRFRSPWQICHNSSLRALMEAQFAAKCSSMIALPVQTNLMRWCDLRQGVFEVCIVGLLFWAFSLGPPLAKSQKMADLGLLGKFVITRLYGHLWRRSLQQNVPLWLHLECMLIRRWCDSRQVVFEARIVGLLFWAFSLGPPLAKSQKMADLGLLGKFVITRLYGHLWRRSLQQTVPLWLHFKYMLIRRWCNSR